MESNHRIEGKKPMREEIGGIHNYNNVLTKVL